MEFRWKMELARLDDDFDGLFATESSRQHRTYATMTSEAAERNKQSFPFFFPPFVRSLCPSKRSPVLNLAAVRLIYLCVRINSRTTEKGSYLPEFTTTPIFSAAAKDGFDSHNPAEITRWEPAVDTIASIIIVCLFALSSRKKAPPVGRVDFGAPSASSTRSLSFSGKVGSGILRVSGSATFLLGSYFYSLRFLPFAPFCRWPIENTSRLSSWKHGACGANIANLKRRWWDN